MFEWLFKYPLSDYLQGSWGFSYSIRIELLLLILVAIAYVVFAMYRRESAAKKSRRGTLAMLRFAGLALLLIVILRPVLRMQKQDTGSGSVAVAIDVSKSMSLDASSKGGSRFERAREAISGHNGILEKLKAAGDIKLFVFGNSLHPVSADELKTLTPSDENTRLAAAIKEMAQSARATPFDAIVLLTDGAETTTADPATMARYAASRGATVHAVGFGDTAATPDVEILSVQYPRKAAVGTLVDLRVQIRRGTVVDPLDLRLYQDGALANSVPVPASKDGEPVVVSLHIIPDKLGKIDYRLEIPPVAGETNLENNKRAFQIETEEPRVEVLLVEGSPRHEFAFIRRMLASNKQFRIVSLLRLGKGRFYQSGNDNTLLSNGFPETAEALGRFKAIVLSDIEASFFTPAQLALIGDFVKTRGGGLLMLGGVNSFNLGGYENTEMAGLLPVSLAANQVAPVFDDSEYTFQVTKEGATHEILRLASDPAENSSQWALMPALKGVNPLYAAKPGALVLATRIGSGVQNRESILLAVQEVGAGRTAAFAPSNSWRWKMLRPYADDTFIRFWSQMLRWLAVGSKELLAVSTDRELVNVHGSVTISAQVLDRSHLPCNTAKVSAAIKDPFGNIENLALPWVLSEDGMYQATYIPADKGEYAISVSAEVLEMSGQTKQPAGPLVSNAWFAAIESSLEFTHSQMDAAGLERIAKAGNGTVDLTGNPEKAIQAILEQLGRKHETLNLVEERECWDAPILLFSMLGLWIAEWILRKRSGLA